jgi:hypothetical protein
MPHSEYKMNKEAITNEFVILVFIIFCKIFTPWVSESGTRYFMCFVPLILIVVNLLYSAVPVVI